MLTHDDLQAIQQIVKKEIGLETKPIKKELSYLKKDVGDLKTEVGGLKADMGGLKKDVGDLKEGFKELSDKIDVTNTIIERNTKDLTDLILAGFATHEPILKNHGQRITRLEKATFTL